MEQLEEVEREVLVEGVAELVDRRRNLQPLVQDLALPLDAHVLRPLDVAAELNSRLRENKNKTGEGRV